MGQGPEKKPNEPEQPAKPVQPDIPYEPAQPPGNHPEEEAPEKTYVDLPHPTPADDPRRTVAEQQAPRTGDTERPE